MPLAGIISSPPVRRGVFYLARTAIEVCMRFYFLALLLGVIFGATVLTIMLPQVQRDVVSRKCHITGLAAYASGNTARIDAMIEAAANGPQPSPATPCK